MKRNIRQFVYNSSSVRFKSHDSYGETHHSKCSVFAFDFETCIKTIFPLISCLLNEALLVADHVSVRCCFSSLTSIIAVSDKHDPACRFQSVSEGCALGRLMWFSCSQSKVNGACYCDVLLLKQLLPDICQTAGDFCTTSAAQQR